jgi:hypothetical protein
MGTRTGGRSALSPPPDWKSESWPSFDSACKYYYKYCRSQPGRSWLQSGSTDRGPKFVSASQIHLLSKRRNYWNHPSSKIRSHWDHPRLVEPVRRRCQPQRAAAGRRSLRPSRFGHICTPRVLTVDSRHATRCRLQSTRSDCQRHTLRGPPSRESKLFRPESAKTWLSSAPHTIRKRNSERVFAIEKA